VESTFISTIPFTKREILFRITNENENNLTELYNLVILHGKYYIYINKKQHSSPNILQFLLLKQELNLNQTYFSEIKKTFMLNNMWGELYNNL
jgi:hypothetical protein